MTDNRPIDLGMPNTRIGQLVTQRMEQHGISIRDLAQRLDITYEHVRRIVRGESIPSRFILKEICAILGISMAEAEEVAQADRIQKKFGPVALKLAGKKPDLEPVERVWDQLTEEQKSSVVNMVNAWAKGNRRTRVS